MCVCVVLGEGETLLIFSMFVFLIKLGCDHNCINYTCKPFSYCDYGCVDGYWGTFCESLCPVNCREHNCTKFRGHCFSCNPGEYGWTCTSKCPRKWDLSWWVHKELVRGKM